MVSASDVFLFDPWACKLEAYTCDNGYLIQGGDWIVYHVSIIGRHNGFSIELCSSFHAGYYINFIVPAARGVENPAIPSYLRLAIGGWR